MKKKLLTAALIAAVSAAFTGMANAASNALTPQNQIKKDVSFAKEAAKQDVKDIQKAETKKVTSQTSEASNAIEAKKQEITDKQEAAQKESKQKQETRKNAVKALKDSI